MICLQLLQRFMLDWESVTIPAWLVAVGEAQLGHLEQEPRRPTILCAL